MWSLLPGRSGAAHIVPAFTQQDAIKLKESLFPLFSTSLTSQERNIFNSVAADPQHRHWHSVLWQASRVLKDCKPAYSKSERKLAVLSSAFYAAFLAAFTFASNMAFSASRPGFGLVFGAFSAFCAFCAGVCVKVGMSSGTRLERSLEQFRSELQKAAQG